MAYQDPREQKREIEDDHHKVQDRDKEIKTEDADPKDDYKYSDWASI